MLNRVGRAKAARKVTSLSLLLAAFCMIVLLLSSPGVVKAQIYYGTISGTVSDSTGAVVSGATITVKSISTGATYKATSSDAGVFTVAQLPVGTYEVRVAQKGFKEYVTTGVEVHTSSSTEVNAQLQLGA